MYVHQEIIMLEDLKGKEFSVAIHLHIDLFWNALCFGDVLALQEQEI